MDQKIGPTTHESVADGMNKLSQAYKGKDWFAEVGQDQYGRIVVYVNFMCHETLHDIPDYVAGKQVLVHFIASKTATRDQFVDHGTKPYVPTYDTTIDTSAVVVEPPDEDDVAGVEEEKSLQYLQRELDRLEKLCGSNTLQDIFYECHDEDIAPGSSVTNLSGRYPEVRERVEKLYNLYGFDVIYEELDG